MKGEDEDMKNFNEFMNRICDENYEKGVKQGDKQGIKKGIKKELKKW